MVKRKDSRYVFPRLKRYRSGYKQQKGKKIFFLLVELPKRVDHHHLTIE